MIEVEKKFILDPTDLKRLTTGAQFISQKVFTDAYYDTQDFALTKADTWLRNRAGKYELKIPLNHSTEEKDSDQYRELETEKEIAEYLHFDATLPLSESLKENGYSEFCRVTTDRKKYKKDDFTIDVDSVEYGYELAEIELMVSDVSEMKNANDRIIAYARSLGLDEKPVRGKVVEYLRRNRPRHYQALVDAKVRNLHLMPA